MVTSFFPTNNNNNISSPCVWTYSITDCQQNTQSSSLHILYYISIIILSILSILSFGLLMFRLWYRNGCIFDDCCFSPLEGFLLWIIFFCLFRIFSNIVQLFDLFKSNYILRNILFTSGYVSIQIATIGYIGGIFKTLPKMQFYLPNSTKTLRLLNSNQIRCYYWIVIIFQFFSIELAAVYEGLSRIRNDEIGITIAYGLHWSCYGILHALITVTLFYYGSTLIKMTQKSFILSGVIPDEGRENNAQLRFFGGNSDPNEITTKHLKLIKNLRKMRIFSYTLTGCFFMCTISLFAMAVMGYKLFEITLLSQLYYALCSIGVPLACIGINFGIIQAEIHPSGLIDTMADLSSYYHSQSESNSNENPL